MKIEILFGDVCNLYADLENIYFLKEVYDDIKIYETKLNEKPKFIDNDIDMVYIGSCSFAKTNIVIEKLLPYKENIKNFIESNKLFLVTGTASEIFGNSIIDNDKTYDGLGLFDYNSIRGKRENFLFLGEFNNIKIVGNKSQSFFLYNIKDNNFINVIKGYGNNKEDSNEGIKYKNFYMTSLLGPFLILNPYFCEYLLGKQKNNSKILEAYNYRLKSLEDKDARIVMGDHG